jgi:hypothetical protein
MQFKGFVEKRGKVTCHLSNLYFENWLVKNYRF